MFSLNESWSINFRFVEKRFRWFYRFARSWTRADSYLFTARSKHKNPSRMCWWERSEMCSINKQRWDEPSPFNTIQHQIIGSNVFISFGSLFICWRCSCFNASPYSNWWTSEGERKNLYLEKRERDSTKRRNKRSLPRLRTILNVIKCLR